MQWIREPHGKPSGADGDTVREGLFRRLLAVQDTLPENLKLLCELGLMHVEHDSLDKSYVNDETMGFDPVKDIPRPDSYVTEDRYAWNVEELSRAITAADGVMRNPLSRQMLLKIQQMFTTKDVRGILMHPKGKKLAALQDQQDEISKGVRPETITMLDKLGKTLLDDDSRNQLLSRQAIDTFMVYIATLPDPEQKAIEGLRCSAQDSHTGQAYYDFSVGEAVRDAKGNRVCFHKTGDIVRQAPAYFRKNRGAAPDIDADDKCVVM